MPRAALASSPWRDEGAGLSLSDFQPAVSLWLIHAPYLANLQPPLTFFASQAAVSYTPLRAHATSLRVVCRPLIEKKNRAFQFFFTTNQRIDATHASKLVTILALIHISDPPIRSPTS
ncbi:hypothetical protein, partial [Acinetobacter baumannii]|uniref:hypothetical protein n=1 Tax=Acinetobacter baumannii TaxID=470 RepID=UPI001D179E9D